RRGKKYSDPNHQSEGEKQDHGRRAHSHSPCFRHSQRQTRLHKAHRRPAPLHTRDGYRSATRQSNTSRILPVSNENCSRRPTFLIVLSLVKRSRSFATDGSFESS